MMGAKMKKGIFNGLRYFTHIFDPKEQEMQIGYPTDVKHVAHIGWDGPSVDHPSWMNQFRSAPLTATVTDDADPTEIPKFPSSEFVLPETKPLEKPPRRKKSSEKSATASPAAESPNRDPSGPKHSRRRRSSAGGSGGDSADGSRRGRRERSGEGPVSGERETSGIPRQSRRRRTKGSSSSNGTTGGESARPRSRTSGNADQGVVEEAGGSGELLKTVGREEEVAS